MCVGHSLGGALASLAAAWAAEQYPLTPVTLYTFGQPRPGDKAFAKHLESVGGYIVRVAHSNDLIPMAPLARLGFSHFYPAVYLAMELMSAARFHFTHSPLWRPMYSRGVADHFLGRCGCLQGQGWGREWGQGGDKGRAG